MRTSEQQRIFITGGASGLGRAIAQRFAAARWKVCIGDIHDARGAETLHALSGQATDAFYLNCDVTQEEDLRNAAARLRERWGGVDVVVNNAGVAQGGAIEDVPLGDWHWILDINLLGVVRGCRVFTPLFKQQGHGHLVNIASMAGLIHPPLMGSYNASKAAVVALSETLLIELADSNIGVTLVCPSFFKTNLTETMRSTDPQLIRSIGKLFERGKLSAEQIADDVYEAQQHGRFLVLPHAAARSAWRIKNWLPRRLYALIAIRQSRRIRKRSAQRPA